MPAVLTAWTGRVPQQMLTGALPASAKHAFARWDGRGAWVLSDRAEAQAFAPHPVIAYGRPPFAQRERSEQPLVLEGWCLAHQGLVPNPDRLWMGRVPSGLVALAKRLEWVGRQKSADMAVREVAEMLGFATESAQAVVVGSPDGAVHVMRLNHDAGGLFRTARGGDWAVASTSAWLEGGSVSEGVTRL